MKSTQVKSNRKPVGWMNRFDEILSLEECPPGKNLPYKYRKDFKFIGRKVVNLEAVTRNKDTQVRVSTVNTENVVHLANSFKTDNYLHEKYPPIVIQKNIVAGNKTIKQLNLWIGNNRFNAAEAIGWKKMMVDVYECTNLKALLTASCTTNHHKGVFKLMSKDDYIKVCKMASFGTEKSPRVLGNGSMPTKDEIRSYTDEIVGNMLPKSYKNYIVDTVWGQRDIDNTVESYQPYSLSTKGANSVEELARGNNQYAPKVKIPFKGNKHFDIKDNEIEQSGYTIPDKGTGFRDNIPLAIRESVSHDRDVLFYIYIVEKASKPFTDSMIDEARVVARAKFDTNLNYYLNFASEVSGVKKKDLNLDRFKFVGFLPQKIYTSPGKNGELKESTIVDVKGNPVNELTGELL